MTGSDRMIELLPDAEVTRASATVTAAPEARSRLIGEIASVSPEKVTGSPLAVSVIVDFGAPCTVSSINLAVPFSALESIDDAQVLLAPTAVTRSSGSFAECTTRRLRVTFQAPGVPPAEVATSGSVVVAVPVSDLEVFVNANRVWGYPGRADPTPPSKEFVIDNIDLRQALQDEVDAGRVPLRVRLRARTPATLTLGLSGRWRLAHDVVFAEGPARAVDAAEEGDVLVELPLPPDAAKARIAAVRGTLTAQAGPERVLPATGPPLSGKASLIVDPERAVVIGLAKTTTDALSAVAGVRVPVRAGPDGAELRGTLRADVDGAPGAPVARGQLGPATIEPGAGLRWVSLNLVKARKLAPGAVWVELATTRGRVELPLAASRSADWPLAGPTVAEVRRPTGTGGYRRLSAVAGIETNLASIRVIGVPRANAPIFPANVGAVYPAGVDATAQAQFTVAATGTVAAVAAELGDDSALVGVPRSPAAQPHVTLRVTAATAGTYTLCDVTVAYAPADLPVA